MTGVTAMARFTAQLMDTKGVTYPARDVADWLGESDFVHASNEVSFTETCEPKPDRSERLFCSRDSYIELLAALHVNVVELTGSHLIDFGLGKLRRTIGMYEARGWKFFGGGRDQIEATRPAIIEHHGNKLAFLGCNVPRSENATIVNGPNVAFCDLARLEWQVRDLASRGITPIVSIQHNEVRGHAPPTSLVSDFRRLARAGAAAVLGSQAHVPHPFEAHAGAYVHFGLGNFIFDQPWGSTRDGVIDRLYFHKGKLLTVRRLYTRIEEQGRPRPLDARERAAFLRILAGEAEALPRPRKPRAAAQPPGIPDSFLVGKQAVYIRVELAGADATVSLRAKPRGLRKKQLHTAITELITTKYGIDRQRVTIR
jgi:poly-gamma-glutamate synthesis protein (capsule biosynthesis protein)